MLTGWSANLSQPDLAPFVPAAPRPTLPGPREPALFLENSDLPGAAEAVRPLAELTNVDALAAWAGRVTKA